MSAAIGSRWYAQGHHWEVIGHGTRDGEPSLLLRCLTGGTGSKRNANVIERLFLRKAEPTNGRSIMSEATATAKREVQPDPKDKDKGSKNGSKPKAEKKQNSATPAKAPAPKAEEKVEAPPLTAEQIDAELAALEPILEKHKGARKAYNAAQAEVVKAKTNADKAPHEETKAKHVEGYRAHRKADNRRRELRKLRESL